MGRILEAVTVEYCKALLVVLLINLGECIAAVCHPHDGTILFHFQLFQAVAHGGVHRIKEVVELVEDQKL